MKPRRHHYCPAGYLANFSHPSERRGKLIVTDAKNGSQRPSTPDNEAHQRDFYRIDVNNEDDPFILESEFEKIESPALASIKRIIQSNEMPVGENLNWIINFIGLLAARVPTIRKKWENFETDIYLKTLQMFTTSKASFNSVVSNLGKEGENIDVTFEEMKEFIDNERFKIDIPRNSSVERMLHSAAAIIDLLQHRKWSLIIADSNYEFITSDNPVVLKWIKNVKGFFGPGFGLSNTEVSLTISPKHMLLGVYEDIQGVFKVNDFGVASVNEYLHLTADRWIYSNSNNPCTVDENQNIVSIIDKLKSRKKK